MRGNQLAFPLVSGLRRETSRGLTIREYAAIHIASAFVSTRHDREFTTNRAKAAVKFADKLLEALKDD